MLNIIMMIPKKPVVKTRCYAQITTHKRLHHSTCMQYIGSYEDKKQKKEKGEC